MTKPEASSFGDWEIYGLGCYNEVRGDKEFATGCLWAAR